MDDNTTQIITVLLGGVIAIAAAVITNLFNTRSIREERQETIRRNNAELQWQEIKRDTDAVEALIWALTLYVREQLYLLEMQKHLHDLENAPSQGPKLTQEKWEKKHARIVQEVQETEDRLREYHKQTREQQARGASVIYSMPDDIQEAFFAFDKEISMYHTQVFSGIQQQVSNMNIIRTAGAFRGKIRDYLAQARTETSIRGSQ